MTTSQSDRARRVRKKRLLTVGGLWLLFMGILERAAGWLSGATGGDFSAAARRLQRFLDGLPVFGLESVQWILTAAGLLGFAWLWWTEAGRPSVGSFVATNANVASDGPISMPIVIPQLKIVYDSDRHRSDSIINIGVNTDYVGVVKEIDVEVISLAPLARVKELEPACKSILSQPDGAHLWKSARKIIENRELRIAVIERGTDPDKFLICLASGCTPIAKGSYRMRVRATGVASPFEMQLGVEAEFEIGMKGDAIYLKPASR